MRGKYFIKDSDSKLKPVEEGYKGLAFCGYYAAIGWNGETAGNLFAVFTTPILVPVYDKKSRRVNVGEEKSGMSYTEGRGWYNE